MDIGDRVTWILGSSLSVAVLGHFVNWRRARAEAQQRAVDKRIEQDAQVITAREEYKGFTSLVAALERRVDKLSADVAECQRDREYLHRMLDIVPALKVRDQIMANWIKRHGGELPDMPEVIWPGDEARGPAQT